VADEPVSTTDLARAIPGLGGGKEARRILKELAEEYDRENRAFELVEIAGGFRLVTREVYLPWLKRFMKEQERTRLSPAALETLAIVAYRQPVMRAEIENVRGVGSGPVLRMLLERRLVRIAGRAEKPGSPILYGTTREFLEHFGLKSLQELPRRGDLKGI